MERIAKVAQTYWGKEIAPGQRFEVEPEDINLLLLLDRIEIGEPEKEKDKENTQDDRQMTADHYKNRAINGRRGRGR